MPDNSNIRLTVLRDYATRKHPEKLPPSVLFDYTDNSIAIFDAYPKAIFHFLILPRPQPPLSVFDLSDLRTLLHSRNVGKARAKEVLEHLGEHAQKLRAAIEEEMMSRYGFTWKIWTGFHAVPSMQYVHRGSLIYCHVDQRTQTLAFARYINRPLFSRIEGQEALQLLPPYARVLLALRRRYVMV